MTVRVWLFANATFFLWLASVNNGHAYCPPAPDSITQGPRVGATTDTTSRIWVRGCSTVEVVVEYKLASDPWSYAHETDPVSTDPDADHTAVVSVSGLSPSTEYGYRVLVNGELPSSSLEGSFRTMPEEGVGAEFSFVVGTDIHHLQQGISTIMGSIIEQDPDLVLFIGDNVLIEQFMNNFFGGGVPESKAEYELCYKVLFSDPAFSALIGNTPMLSTWDDHEIWNDWDHGMAAFPYPFSREAWDEYMGSANHPPRASGAMHYSFRVGDVDFYVLDTRSYRSLGEDPDGPFKTMLGAEQKADLKNWLLTSTAKFKFVVSSVMWNDFSNHIQFGESWPVYQTERNEIFNFIRVNEIRGVMLLSGDEHWGGVFRMEPWGIYEVAAGPISWPVGATSSNDPQILFKWSWKRVYCVFEVDTANSPATMTMRVMGSDGQTLYTLELREDDLTPREPKVPSLQELELLILVLALATTGISLLNFATFSRPSSKPCTMSFRRLRPRGSDSRN